MSAKDGESVPLAKRSTRIASDRRAQKWAANSSIGSTSSGSINTFATNDGTPTGLMHLARGLMRNLRDIQTGGAQPSAWQTAEAGALLMALGIDSTSVAGIKRAATRKSLAAKLVEFGALSTELATTCCTWTMALPLAQATFPHINTLGAVGRMAMVLVRLAL